MTILQTSSSTIMVILGPVLITLLSYLQYYVLRTSYYVLC